jgi:glycosyltransferase involved in cell wall biosynthesis
MLDQITPLLLTYNEAANIGRTLEQLRWAGQIIVVDSFSDDETLQIVSRYPQVKVFQRKFDNFASQCNFGLTKTSVVTEWVLSLDADYILTDEIIDELANLEAGDDLVGLRARFVYCINGKRLRSGIYPPVTVLFRKANANYLEDGHAHRVALNGRIENLRAPILHDDRKPLARWFAAQSRYTKLEARKLSLTKPEDLSWTDRARRWRIVAPPAMLFYCLILRGGILDGWAGFYYAFQRALAELMLSLYLMESGKELTESVGQSAKGKGEAQRAKCQEQKTKRSQRMRRQRFALDALCLTK